MRTTIRNGHAALLGILLATMLAACGDSNSEDQTEKNLFLRTVQAASTTYGWDAVSTLVFQPYCMQCHATASAGNKSVALDSYADAFPHISDILSETTAGKMPPKNGPLAAYPQEILTNWIQMGAPETSTTPLPPNPTAGADMIGRDLE